MDDLDELGIYRDKGGSNGSADQGILVDPLDEDGIWREDPDPLDHYSYKTVHTDSGLGADKKSSSTTLNQVKSDFGSDEDYNQNLPLHREHDEYPHHQLADSASQVDSKSSHSYRISELEASESVQGDEVSLENILDSDHDLEFPELNDESYMFSDQSNQRLRSASQSGASDKSTDLDKYISHLKYTDNAASRQKTTKDTSRSRPFALDPAIVGYSDSFGGEGDIIGDGLNRYYYADGDGINRNLYGNDFDEKHNSSEGEDVSDIGEDYDNAKDNHINAAMAKLTARHRNNQKAARDTQRPPITGDSIFTQEELSMPKHSLHEFEKLEVALNETESDNDGEQMDLIGAYLQGLKDRDEEEDQVNDQEVASHQLPSNSPAPATTPSAMGHGKAHPARLTPSKIPTRSQSRSPAKSPMMNGGRSSAKSPARTTNRSPSKSPSRSTGIPSPTRMYNKSPSRQHLRTSPLRSVARSPHSRGLGKSPTSPTLRGNELVGGDRRRFSPSSPRMFDTEKNGYRRTRDTISMISGSVDEIMLEPSNSDNDEEDEHTRDSLDHPPREGEPDDPNDTAYSYGDSIPFDSMIINQQFPYADDPYSSLHAYDYKDNEQENFVTRTESPQRSTKIPMLRSRSPSMSRPGSSLGNRSRPTSCGPNSRPESPVRKMFGPNQTGIPVLNGNASMKGSRRSLPLTPKKRKNADGTPSLDTSIENNLTKTPRSGINGEMSVPHSARSDTGGVLEIGYQLSQAESELGRATNLLMMDDDEIQRQTTMQDIVEEEKDEVPATLPSSIQKGSKKGTAKWAGKPPIHSKDGAKGGNTTEGSPELKLSLEEYSGGEDLSQGSVASKGELKNRYVHEVKTRKRNEETVKQLSFEYSNLLKKYAEAENTIDELRLGAKVTLYSNSPTPSNAQSGTTHVVHHPGSYPVVSGGGQAGQEGSQGLAMKAELGILPDQGQRPPSRNSQGSSVAAGTDNLSLQPQAPSLHPSLSHDELESLAGEGVKLSLLTKAKGIEEQVNAFRILLEENHLNLDDQKKAMENIKANYDNVQKDYHAAKEEHVYIRRQGALTEAATTETTAFDEENEVAGELYKLNMKMDELENTVQENSKKIAASRKPFAGKSGPVRADHTIFGLDKQGNNASTDKPGVSVVDSQDPHQLPINRPASIGSMAGTADVDERLHNLSKKYGSLMDKYRQLKGLKPTPLRSQEIDSLLNRIKEVYEETPDHRKPPLPPELENKYDTKKGSFVKPEDIPEDLETVSPRSLYSARTKPPADDIASTDERDSDYRTDRYHTSRSPPSYSPPRRARYGSLDSNSTDYTDKTPAVHPSRAHVRAGSESDLNSPRIGRRNIHEQKDRDSRRNLPKPGPGAGSRRRDPRLKRGDGGDSGYFGSEGSRKAVSSAGGKVGERSAGASTSVGHGSRGFPSRRGTTGTSMSTGTAAFGSPRSRDEGDLDSDVSSSGSASSVIERKMERRRAAAAAVKEDGVTGRDHSAEGVSRAGLSSKSQSLGESAGHVRSRSRSQSRGKQATLSESDRSASLNSGELASPRSEKLRTLTDEVERLKATISNPIVREQQPPQLLIQGQPQTLITGNTAAGVPAPIMQQPQIGMTPQGFPAQPPMVNFADPASVAMGTAQTMNGYPAVYPQEPIPAAMAPQLAPGYDYYNGYNMNNYGELPPDPREYYDQDYNDYEGDDYEPAHYRDNRRRSLERGGGRYRGQHRSGSRERFDGDEYDLRDSPREYNDYDSRDRDFSDIKAARYNRGGRKASLPDNYYTDSYGGGDNRYEGESRSGGALPQHRRNYFDDLLDEYDPSSRARSHHGRRNKSHDRYYSDPESPAHSPSRYSEMRQYYIPKRGHTSRGRDHSGSRSPSYDRATGGGHNSRRERYLSPNRVRAGRGPAPRGGPNGLPPPYPAAQRVARPAVPVPGAYNAYQTPSHMAANAVVRPSGYPVTTATGVMNNTPAVHPGYRQQAYTPGGVDSAASAAVVPVVSQQQQMTACPTCGGKNMHTHSNFVFQPQPVTSTAAAANSTSNTQNGLVPVQLLPVSSSNQSGNSKVRYYVREYGGESNSGVNPQGNIIQKQSRRIVKTVVLSDESDDEDMDESLNKALRTAKKLKKMSVRMKMTLHDEINKSIQDGSFLMT